MESLAPEIEIQNFIVNRKGIKPLFLAKDYFENSVIYLDIDAIENNINIKYVDKDTVFISSTDDILVIWDGSRCGLAFLSKHGAVGSTFMNIKPVGLNKKYLYYFLKKNFDIINENSKGSSIPHVDANLFFKQKIPFISLKKQQDFIETLEKKYSHFQNLHDEQKKILKKILREANTSFEFLNNDIENSINNFKKSVINHFIKSESNIKIEKLKNITTLITSGARDWSKYYSNDGILFVRIGNQQKLSINLDISEITKINIPDSIFNPNNTLKHNDILISITGSNLGLISLIPENFPTAFANQHLALIRLNKNYNAKYIAWALLSEYCYSQIMNLQTGQNRGGITLEKLREVNIPIPTDEECERISSKIEMMFEVTDNVHRNYIDSKYNIDMLEKSLLHDSYKDLPLDSELNVNAELDNIKNERLKIEKEYITRNKIMARKKNLLQKEMIKTETVLDLLKVAPDNSMTVEDLWINSKYSDDNNVEQFYEELTNIKNIVTKFSSGEKLTTIVTLL